MGGDEIDRDLILDTMANETINPRSLSCRWTTDPKARAHIFQRNGSDIIQMVVSGFFGISGPEVYIGFVPQLEIPLGDFVDPVTIDQMLCKR